MKSLILFCLLTVSSFSYAAGILEIVVPTGLCANQTETFSTKYFFYNNPSGYPKEQVISVTFDFLQNNVVKKTVNASGFTQPSHYGGPGTATVKVLGLPVGAISVRVTVKTLYMVLGGGTLKTYTLSKAASVGPVAPTTISGPANICQGVLTTYASTAVAGAASYTWEVPAGWTVDGLPGPVVTGRAASVKIVANGALQTSGVVKVAAVSSVCGASAFVTKSVMIDYPKLTLTSTKLNDYETRLRVTPTTYSDYSWILPNTWTVNEDGGYFIDFYTNGQADTARVSAVTACQTLVDGIYFVDPGDIFDDGCTEFYPTLVQSYIMVDPCSGHRVVSAVIDGSWSLTPSEISQEGELFRLDATRITPGIHVLEITSQYNDSWTFRFVKE